MLADVPAEIGEIVCVSVAPMEAEGEDREAKGKNRRFGVIEFAISADVTAEFRQAVAQLPEAAWQTFDRIVDGERYVPASNGRKSATCRTGRT